MNNEFLEIETLGPMTRVAPGRTVDRVEHWGLFRNVPPPELTDDGLTRSVLPLVQAVAVGG